jgi:hypothetical protein
MGADSRASWQDKQSRWAGGDHRRRDQAALSHREALGCLGRVPVGRGADSEVEMSQIKSRNCTGGKKVPGPLLFRAVLFSITIQTRHGIIENCRS